MIEIEFSAMGHTRQDTERLIPLLERFEREKHIRVHLIPITWDKGWHEIADMAIYRHGADVSEIGSTWVSSLVSMNAIQPLSQADVNSIGGAGAFYSSIWQSGIVPGDVEQVWAIPWHAYPIVWYYYKDQLERVGIEANTAFRSVTSLNHALMALQEGGIPYPLGLTTAGFGGTILQEAAPWIWNAGGDFLSADQGRVTFHEDSAIAGLQQYFSLCRYVNFPDDPSHTTNDLFFNNQVAVVAQGPWPGLVGRTSNPNFASRLGAAPSLGTGYVGGISLVVWKHTRHLDAAKELVRFLSVNATQAIAVPHAHNIPVRKKAMTDLAAQDPFYQVYIDALTNGRIFPATRLWGMVEDRLGRAFINIWAELRANPSLNLTECLHRNLDPLGRRLNLAMGS